MLLSSWNIYQQQDVASISGAPWQRTVPNSCSRIIFAQSFNCESWHMNQYHLRKMNLFYEKISQLSKYISYTIFHLGLKGKGAFSFLRRKNLRHQRLLTEITIIHAVTRNNNNDLGRTRSVAFFWPRWGRRKADF